MVGKQVVVELLSPVAPHIDVLFFAGDFQHLGTSGRDKDHQR